MSWPRIISYSGRDTTNAYLYFATSREELHLHPIFPGPTPYDAHSVPLFTRRFYEHPIDMCDGIWHDTAAPGFFENFRPQHSRREGPPNAQHTMKFRDGSTVTFGKFDPVPEFDDAFAEQIVLVDHEKVLDNAELARKKQESLFQWQKRQTTQMRGHEIGNGEGAEFWPGTSSQQSHHLSFNNHAFKEQTNIQTPPASTEISRRYTNTSEPLLHLQHHPRPPLRRASTPSRHSHVSIFGSPLHLSPLQGLLSTSEEDNGPIETQYDPIGRPQERPRVFDDNEISQAALDRRLGPLPTWRDESVMESWDGAGGGG